MDETVGFVFISILHFALNCGCSDVFLSADRQFVTEYSALTFTCSTLNDARFADFYENRETHVARIGYKGNKCTSIIYDRVSNCSCLNLTTYTCTTIPLNRTNNNDIWSCVSTQHNLAGTKSKNYITIDVRVPIASVSISPHQNNPMTINEGEVLQLTCETSYGLPAANISWYLDNNTDSVYVDDRILNASKQEVNETVDRTKSVKSTLTHTVSREEDGMGVYCNANPPDILALWVNTTCMQNYPIKQKVLRVLEHDRVRVECFAAGNPEPTCQWTNHSQSRTLDILKAAKEDAGAYVCHAFNTMKTSFGNPPNITNLNRSVEVLEGVNFNLTCEAEPGNSNVTSYYWTNKASIMTFTAMNTTRTTVQHGDEVNFYCEVDSDPPAFISILTANGSIIKNIHGKNQLNYTKKSSCLTDIGPFTCLSANKHNSKQPDRRNVTAHLYIGRITFQNTPLKLDQEVSVFSNPPPTYFTWTNVSNNMQIPIVSTASDRVIINSTDNMSTALIITSVASWDSGNYSVRVENEIGYKIETFYIIVDVQSTIANTPQNDKRNGSKYIIAIVGSVCGIAVVVLLLRLWWLKRSTPIHVNNTLQLLRDTRHDSGRMETIVDNVLPINDETPEYEGEKHIYANIQIKDAFGGKSLTIKTLRYTLRQLKVDPSPLFKEFYTLQIGLKYDTKDALKPRNVSKNRYRNDASRVVLPFVRRDPDSDFINASYIDGYSKPRKYIAAQGPLENTISDTWRMIHLEDIKIIVMVTNLIETCKKKCSKYWPDERATYGKYNVKLDHVEQYADFAVRHFTYSMEGTRFKRQLIQFHYTSWPDKNVPTTALSLVQFWRKVRQSEFVEKTPWMVHCSAGVGRTGTFIALDYLYDQGKVYEKLNVPETVNVLREQRVSLVQTKEQYLYLHEAISELLDPIGLIFTSENSKRFQSTVTDDRKLNKEFEAITDAVVNVKTVENEKDFNRMPDGQLPENKCKSIDMNVIPDDMFRPLISSGNDFINAVYIPTYREGQKYIVTQFPLQNTTVDFVRLLWDHNIRDVEQYQFCHEVVFEYLKNRVEKVEDSENQEYVNMTFPKFL
ncbi:PTPRK-like protein [Mya arenaria]|uniref:PTPRK-like protein n=1 Tax=Mya arenaria TaxID=6604 RepID=A0ABY7E4F2_MYAAR|nr:PTPRK-like protein [Mya arenaria]